MNEDYIASIIDVELEENIELENGVKVDKAFFDQIHVYARNLLPNLSPDRVYESDSLLDIELHDPADCILAEMCLDHIAKQNLLPMTALRRGQSGPKIYILN
jgi:hypothetical protein